MANQEPSDSIDPQGADSAQAAQDEGPAEEAGAQAAPGPEQDPARLQEALQQAQAKAQEYWDKLLRVQAELDNLRKRSQRDLDNAHKYAIERFVGELLPVKDSLDLGLGHSREQADAEKLHEGMDLTLKMLAQVFDKFHVEEIDPQGQPFDPAFHQAMTLQENSELPPNTVISVMQKGYTLNRRLLRPAMVIVSKRPQA